MNLPDIAQSFLVGRYRFTLECVTSMHLPLFVGNMLRGALGAGFRNLVCVTQEKTCSGCFLRQQCAYGYVFETQGDGSAFGSAMAPRPHVLEPPELPHRELAETTRFSFDLMLFGARAIAFLPYIIYVFRSLEKKGLGLYRKAGTGRYRLLSVEGLYPQQTLLYNTEEDQLLHKTPAVPLSFLAELPLLEAIPSSEPLTLRFRTPVRMIKEGKTCQTLTFADVMVGIYRRLEALIRFHGTGESLPPLALAPLWDIETVEHTLVWQQQTRYSMRQHQVIPMDGLTGTVTFRGPWADYAPWLQIGTWLHIGKGTVMGQGEYDLIPDRLSRM